MPNSRDSHLAPNNCSCKQHTLTAGAEPSGAWPRPACSPPPCGAPGDGWEARRKSASIDGKQKERAQNSLPEQELATDQVSTWDYLLKELLQKTGWLSETSR